ncbi:MAG: multiheme c-type cytochrome [Gammaproteobacteria bacterium]
MTNKLSISAVFILFIFALTSCNPAQDVENDASDNTEQPGQGLDSDLDSGSSSDSSSDNHHANLMYSEYPSNCIDCHADEANQVHASTHYKWLGQAPDMANATFILQGKLTNAINSYCINIEGDWASCGTCHAGRGKRPDDISAGLENIDCLVCHNEDYATARKRLPDGSMGVDNPVDSMVQNIQEPTRASCLSCHAKAGGGDGVKRGDLSLALVNNNDKHFDYHMSSSGANLSCQDCHSFEDHRVIGKGSDIQPTDDIARGAELSCTNCHANDINEHPSEVRNHLDHVACQSCHIPYYAKVATETHREWTRHHDGTDATTCSEANPCPGHPYTEKASNLIPEYKWWNRRSDNYLLHDDASRTYNVDKNTYPTSTPLGNVSDGKLYPFKYKTATQPITTADKRLIALDTFEYLKNTGNVTTSVEKGLVNMGYTASEPFQWITTDTYQLINHGVGDEDDHLSCNDCHNNTSRMDLQGSLGYQLKGAKSVVCAQCHDGEELSEIVNGEKDYNYRSIHDKHVDSKRNDCSWCHSFSRPERNLKMP